MRDANVIPLLKGAAKRLDKLERYELIQVYEQYRHATNEWLRKQIVENNRIDILATAILGYDIKPYHLAMMQWQFRHSDSLIMAFRGAGKTTTCAVTKVIHYICKERNVTILIGSESKQASSGILREIKQHLEANDRLIEVFGKFYDPRQVSKWDTVEIDVVGKTRRCKESTITCTGVDSAITSKHFDVAITDDLVTQDNSETPHTREKAKTWYYKTYLPLLHPPDPKRPSVGNHHRLGVRYHFDDLYSHLMDNELKDRTLVIKALDENENSPDPERFPPEHFKRLREEQGVIIFNSQYQCDTEAMKGEVFQYDHCQQISESEYPPLGELRVYMGADLAVKDQERHSMFSIVVIGLLGSIVKDDFRVYWLDFYLDHLRATRQPEKVLEFYDKWKPLRTGIETVQYQEVLADTVKEQRPGMVVEKIPTVQDKILRSWKAAPVFENKRVFFRKWVHVRAIDHLVRFPSGKYTTDIFDAYDNAIRAAKRGIRKPRPERQPFGVL